MQSLERRHVNDNFKGMFGFLGDKFALSGDAAEADREAELQSFTAFSAPAQLVAEE